MKVTAEKNKRVAKMIFASIYPLYLSRLVKNGRTKQELNQVIEWLTGFNENKLLELIEDKVTFETFFKKAKIHPNAHLIKGVVCGYRIEEIEDDFEYVANKLEISTQELKTLMTKENKSFRDYRSNYQLINFFTKIARWTGLEKRIIQ